MMEEPLHILLQAIFLLAAGMYPLGFLFGACSACCDETDACQWFINTEGCLKVTVVGSSPETGTTCSVRSSLAFGSVIGTGFTVTRVPLEQEVALTVRISRLNPPEGTRVIVYRMPQSHCTAGCANNSLDFAYDDSSPGWHLEVELTVNRVNEQSLSGIVSQSVGRDSADQPKLFLEVNYFHRPFFDFVANSQPIAIRPSGIQKLYGISGAGVVESGDGTGIQLALHTASVTRETAAIAFAGILCGSFPGINMSLRTKYTFDRVAEFLAGGTFRVDSVNGSQQFDIALMPATVLCDLPANALGVGLTLGAYPESIYIDTGLTDPCFGDISVEAKADAPLYSIFAAGGGVDFVNANPQVSGTTPVCIQSWFKTYRTPTRSAPPYPRANTYNAAAASPSDFYAGKSLLWNIGKEPYRRSFVGSTILGDQPVIFRLDGGASQTSGYFQSENWSHPCRDGFVFLQNSERCVPQTITGSFSEIKVEGFARRHIPGQGFSVNDFNYEPEEPLAGTFSGGSVSLEIGNRPLMFPNFDSTRTLNEEVTAAFEGFFASQQSTAIISYTLPGSTIIPLTMDNGTTFAVRRVFEARLYHNPCTPVETVTPVGLLALHAMGLGFVGSLDDSNGDFWGLFRPVAPSPMGLRTLSCESVEIRSRIRKVCGPWGPSPLPAIGGTLTRQCDLQDAPGETYQTISESTQYPASRNLTDRVIGGGVIQDGVCRLVSLKSHPTTALQWTFLDPSQHFFFPAAEPCLYLRPIFRTATEGRDCYPSSTAYGHPARAVEGDDSPCLSDCTITVAVTANSEQLAAEYLTEGDKAGLIQITAKEGWDDSSTATIVVSCGGDSIEVTITGG